MTRIVRLFDGTVVPTGQRETPGQFLAGRFLAPVCVIEMECDDLHQYFLNIVMRSGSNTRIPIADAARVIREICGVEHYGRSLETKRPIVTALCEQANALFAALPPDNGAWAGERQSLLKGEPSA